MAPRWNDEMNMRFITLYRENELLWDQSHQLYTNKYARESALADIAAEMDIEGFGAAEVNRKIKSLRATYHSEMQKHVTSKKSGCAAEDVYIPSLKWFEDMKYVIAMGTAKERLKKPVQIKLPKRQQNWTEEELTTNQIEEIENEDLFSLTGQGKTEEGLLQPHSYVATTKERTPVKRFKPQPTVKEPPAASVREVRHVDVSQCVLTPVVKESEFDIFGRHVASQLKQLKPEHAVTAIGEISSVLTQKRLATLFGNTNPNNSFSNSTTTSSFSNPQDILSPITILTSDDADNVITEQSLNQV